MGERAQAVAEGLGALIDGVYLRQALASQAPDRKAATALVLNYVTLEINE